MTEGDIDEAIANYETSARFGNAERLALRYSEWMALNPDRLDGVFYESLRRHYTETQIVELAAFIGFNVGYHTFFGSLKFYPMFAPDGRLVSQEESARIYGAVPASLQSAAPTDARMVRHPGDALYCPGESREPENPPFAVERDRDCAMSSRSDRAAISLHIKPLRFDEIRDDDLTSLIGQGMALGVPDEVFPGILARIPYHAKVLLRALLVSHTEGSVDHRLKEIIRIQLARTAGDGYFAGLRSRRAQNAGLDEETIQAGCGAFDENPRFSQADKWALRYAHRLYRAPEDVDAGFYAEGKRHYSEAQIMELGAFIAFHYGMQVFMRALRG